MSVPSCSVSLSKPQKMESPHGDNGDSAWPLALYILYYLNSLQVLGIQGHAGFLSSRVLQEQDKKEEFDAINTQLLVCRTESLP